MRRHYVRDQLRDAMEHLQAAIDPQSPRCACSREAREELRLYLSTWVRGPLRHALDEVENGS